MRSTMIKVAAMSVVVAVAALAPQAAHSHDIHYSGSATGAKGQLTFGTIKKTVTVADVAMACTGTARQETVSSVSVPQPIGLTMQNVHVFSIGRDNVAESTADIEAFSLNLADGFRVKAGAVSTHAEATCTEATRQVTVDGGSTLGYLEINGERQQLSGERQEFGVEGLGRVIVNDRWVSSTGKEIIFYGVRVIVADPTYPVHGEVYFARSRAKISCSKTTPQT